jgi:type IV pilus assembly protein PilA
MVQRDARHRSGRPADGFTLIELMMVVLVISILLLIAVPTFLGARKPAEDKHAQAILRSSLVAARTGFADAGDYGWVTPAALQNEETSVVYLAGASHARATQNEVSVSTGMYLGDTYVILSSASAAGRCFAVLATTSAAMQYQAPALASCNAGAFDPAIGWSSAW